ncbi:MAG: glycosyltransferase family 4 protein [Ardenticatenaceae bacterium]
MSTHKPRVIGVLIGDIVRQPGPRTKYGELFKALGNRFELVDVYDATLRGMDRLINALITFHPNGQRWRQRFYMNVPAFRARSRRTASYLHSMQGKADMVFQLGVLFDAHWKKSYFPSVIYGDYTATLSSKQPDAGRSPFTAKQLKQWIALEQQALDRATHICAWSDFTRASFLSDYQLPPERVTTVGGGLNFATLPDLPSTPVPALRQAQEPLVEGHPPTALFIGKDFYRKGGDLLLRAFAQTRAQIPDARLLMLTSDPIPADLPTEGVEVIAPTWNRAEIEALYRSADLFVLPSRLETWGDVLLEAMAYSVPCIGVSGKAMAEIIEHGKTGLLVSPTTHDVSDLTAALTQLLSNQALCQQWGHAARQRIEEHFTWERVVERMAPMIEAAAFRF